MAVKGFLNSTSHPISHIVIKSHPSGGLGGLSSLQVLRVWSPAGPVASAPPENELAMQILRPRPGTCPIRKSRSRAQQSGFWHSLRGGSDTSWHLRSPCPSCVQGGLQRNHPPKELPPTPSKIPRFVTPRSILVCDFESFICTVRFLVLIYDWVHCIFSLISLSHARDRMAARVWQGRVTSFHKSVQNSRHTLTY